MPLWDSWTINEGQLHQIWWPGMTFKHILPTIDKPKVFLAVFGVALAMALLVFLTKK